MKLIYSRGCTTDSLTIDGFETADIIDPRLAKYIVTLLQNGCIPAKADLQDFIANIVEECGDLTSSGHCEQCGDSYYTYELNVEDI